MYLVFDIGGTNMRLAVSEDGKSIKASRTVPTPEIFEEGIQSIKQVASELLEGKKVDEIGGGIAVIFNKDKSIPIHTSHLHGWVNKPLKETLESEFQATAILENDTAIVGLGEAVYGAGLGKSIVAYITVSTGVGGVRIIDQKIDRNSLGFEAGHQIIVADGNPCDCGGKGHLEAYVSGSGIQRTYGKRGEDINDPKVWDEVARYLAIGLNNVTVFWSPDIIVLGGPVMKSVPIEAVRTYLKEVLTIFPVPPKVELAKTGDMVGLYGALSFINQLR